SGAPLAVSPAGSAPAFAPSGGGFGFIASTPSGAQVERGMIPGSSAAARLAAPAAASSTLDAFVDAQVRGDRKALTALSGPGVDASSVPGAISVTSASGVATPISTTYDTSSRTATVTLASLPAGPLRVAVSTALRDIDGQALAAAFSATVAF